jgi:hypothetical protein
METTKFNEFVKTVLTTYNTLKGGERKKVREILKRQDTYIRHVQRFNQGGSNGMVYDVSRNSGGVLPAVPGTGSSDVGGEAGNNEGVVPGAEAARPGELDGIPSQTHEGQESVNNSEQTAQA